MNNKNTTLENLFEKAKNQETLVSRESARELLGAKGAYSTQNNLKSNKRSTTMYIVSSMIIGAASLGIMTLSGLFNGNSNINTEAPLKEKQEISQNFENTKKNNDDKSDLLVTNKNTNEPKEESDISTIKNNTDAIKEITTNVVEGFKDKADVEGIHFIELSPKELEKLGIKVGADGSYVSYYEKFGKEFEKWNVNVNWGVSRISNDENQKPEFVIAPSAITDIQGNKRLVKFQDENSRVMKYNVKFDPKETIPNNEDYSFEFYNEDYSFEFNIDVDDIDFKNIDPNYLKTLDSTIAKLRNTNPEDLGALENLIREKIIILNDSVHTNLFDHPITDERFEFKNLPDSENDEQISNLNELKIDSSKQYLVMGQHRTVEPDERAHLTIENEDGDSEVFMIEWNSITENPESVNEFLEDFQTKIQNKDNPFSILDELKESINETIQINKLIPVKVNVPNANLYNESTGKMLEGYEEGDEFAFIFWFEPTEEFIDALPNELQNKLLPEITAFEETDSFCDMPKTGEENYFDIWRACDGSLENLAVYPNPADGEINVKYNLTENRNITISIHDIFGRRIQDLSTPQSKSAGEYLDKFNVSEIKAGMYLIVIKSDTGEQVVQRVIKR